MFQASGYQKLTELGAAKLRKARGVLTEGGRGAVRLDECERYDL